MPELTKILQEGHPQDAFLCKTLLSSTSAQAKALTELTLFLHGSQSHRRRSGLSKSERPNVILSGQLLHSSGNLQLKQRRKNLSRPQLRFQPLHQIIQLRRLIVP